MSAANNSKYGGARKDLVMKSSVHYIPLDSIAAMNRTMGEQTKLKGKITQLAAPQTRQAAARKKFFNRSQSFEAAVSSPQKGVLVEKRKISKPIDGTFNRVQKIDDDQGVKSISKSKLENSDASTKSERKVVEKDILKPTPRTDPVPWKQAFIKKTVEVLRPTNPELKSANLNILKFKRKILMHEIPQNMIQFKSVRATVITPKSDNAVKVQPKGTRGSRNSNRLTNKENLNDQSKGRKANFKVVALTKPPLTVQPPNSPSPPPLPLPSPPLPPSSSVVQSTVVERSEAEESDCLAEDDFIDVTSCDDPPLIYHDETEFPPLGNIENILVAQLGSKQVAQEPPPTTYAVEGMEILSPILDKLEACVGKEPAPKNTKRAPNGNATKGKRKRKSEGTTTAAKNSRKRSFTQAPVESIQSNMFVELPNEHYTHSSNASQFTPFDCESKADLVTETSLLEGLEDDGNVPLFVAVSEPIDADSGNISLPDFVPELASRLETLDTEAVYESLFSPLEEQTETYELMPQVGKFFQRQWNPLLSSGGETKLQPLSAQEKNQATFGQFQEEFYSNLSPPSSGNVSPKLSSVFYVNENLNLTVIDDNAQQSLSVPVMATGPIDSHKELYDEFNNLIKNFCSCWKLDCSGCWDECSNCSSRKCAEYCRNMRPLYFPRPPH